MIRSHNGARAVAFVAALMAVFFFTTVNQAQAGTIGVPTGTGVGGAVDGTIAGNPRHQGFAGLIKVTIDGTETFAYCIDIHNGLQFNQPHEEGDWSESNVANLGKITRILRQYPADGTAARGDAVEAAAVQAAIWHFSDGFDLTGGDPGVVAAYDQIVADANAHPATEPGPSLELDPAARTGKAGDYLDFTLTTTATGAVSLVVSPSGGASLVSCDAAHSPIGATIGGPFPKRLCLHRTTAGGPISLTATAAATVAAGKVFLRAGSQKLVLASSRTVESRASSTGTWTQPPPAPNQAPSVTLPCPEGGYTYGESAEFTAIGRDPENNPLTYSWKRNGSTLPGSGDMITVILQARDVLQVTVTDSHGASSSPATLSESCGQAPPPPTILPPRNQAPTVTLSCPAGGYIHGESATFTAVGQDPENNPLTYSWKQNGVTLPGTGSSITATLQARDVLQVIATDSKGASSSPATLSESCGQAPPPPTIVPTPTPTPTPAPTTTPAPTALVTAAPVAAPVTPAAKPKAKPVAKAKPKVKAKAKPKMQVKAKVKAPKLKQQPTAKKAKPRVLPFTP